jgi:DNA-binding LacI/PurR family transcriptional regulator
MDSEIKKITMKDIAAEAGVSITTVSKILNHVDMHISEATRERALGLAQRYHYCSILYIVNVQ